MQLACCLPLTSILQATDCYTLQWRSAGMPYLVDGPIWMDLSSDVTGCFSGWLQ